MKNFTKLALAALFVVSASQASAQSMYNCTLKVNGLRSALSAGTQPGYNLTSGVFRMSQAPDGVMTQGSSIVFTYTGSSTDPADQDALYSMTHSTIRTSLKVTSTTKTGNWTMDGVLLGNMTSISGFIGSPSVTAAPTWSATSAHYRSTSNSLSCTRR